MKFRSEYKAQKAPFSLDPQKPVVLSGSCFSQHIAAKMTECRWEAINPLGTLYNPYSISSAIEMMVSGEKGKERFESSLFCFNGVWNSHMFDSSFSSSVREDCLKEFEIRQNTFKNKLSEGKAIIITFGTSICQCLKENSGIVGNCHKQPSSLFYERRLSINEITDIWHKEIKNLKESFPGIRFIFTVSPVRHLKNGFEGNSRSKAILQLAIEEICLQHDNCWYFPAFEILNDDLRDYRFYASDLVHPSEEAVEYIWGNFLQTFVDEPGLRYLEEGKKAWKASHHRPKLGALGKPIEPIEKGTHP